MTDFQASFRSCPGYLDLDICQFVNDPLEVVPKTETDTSGGILSVTELSRTLTSGVLDATPLLTEPEITLAFFFFL